jgi:hypothetical protein
VVNSGLHSAPNRMNAPRFPIWHCRDETTCDVSGSGRYARVTESVCRSSVRAVGKNRGRGESAGTRWCECKVAQGRSVPDRSSWVRRIW